MLANLQKIKLNRKSILLASVALLPMDVSAQQYSQDVALAESLEIDPDKVQSLAESNTQIVERTSAGAAAKQADAAVVSARTVVRVAAAEPEPQPTGIDKVLVEKYGYEFVNGKAYAPGKAPAPVVPVAGNPAAGNGPIAPVVGGEVPGGVFPMAPVPGGGAFDFIEKPFEVPGSAFPIAPVVGGEVPGGAFPVVPIAGGAFPGAEVPGEAFPVAPVAPVVVPQPTGIDKVLVEKYGYEFVNGKAYAPGKAPAPVVPVAGNPAAGNGPIAPVVGGEVPGGVFPMAPVPGGGAFDFIEKPFEVPGSAFPIAPVVGGEVPGGAFPVAPVVAPQPTGINKILVEKYGYEFVEWKSLCSR